MQTLSTFHATLDDRHAMRSSSCSFAGAPALLQKPSRFEPRQTQRTQQTQCRSGGSSRRDPSRYGGRISIRSDGRDHLGSALTNSERRTFPGPPSNEGPPLRVLPIGGLGEIGMNCMLVGVYDRYILIDAGLMFPDFTDLGMQKILPDASFLAEWRDRIEGVVITHGHEDHIGALPWVVPALDPETPIYAGGFASQLIKRRLQEFNLYEPKRLKTFKMREAFKLGPFEVEPVRVTHSIPDCCGLVLRSEHGTIVHTGDWKIDETPVDGENFDREYFEALGRDGVALMMSDSTNVLSPGRTTSEKDVEGNLIRRVMGHAGKGRVVTTQFASNLHRLASVKKAADASGRKICFVGMSLNTYLQAAQREGMAPMDPRELVPQSAIEEMDPNELLIVTTGSQAEPRAALALAAREASHLLKLRSSDLVLYSAKVIPGNDTRVIQMMNRIAELGPEIAMGRDEGLHTSGHAYRDELEEALQHVKPQHFLPVHGEYAFLCAHAQLAKETGISNTAVIRNGQMLGVWERRNGRTVSTGSMAGLGEVALTNYYNDGNKGTGTAKEMGLEQRQLLAVEGLVIAAVDVVRDPRLIAAATTKAASMSGRTPFTTVTAATGAAAAAAAAAEELLPENVARRQLGARIRITTRAMWTDRGRLQAELFEAANSAIKKLPADATVQAVERSVTDALKRMCKVFNNRRPEIVVLVHEMDPRAGAAVDTINRRRRGGQQQGAGSSWDAAEALLREQQQQDKAFVRVDGVSAGNDKNKQQRRRKAQQDHQQREKDLLFAGRGGDVEELGTAVISDDSAEEEDADVAGGAQDGPGAASPAGGAGAGASGGGGKQRAVGGVPSVGDKISQRSRMAGRSGLMGAGSSSGAMRRTGGTRLPPLQRLDPEEMKRRQRRNPRDAPDEGGNVEYP